jgi:site-specific recombinase XerD
MLLARQAKGKHIGVRVSLDHAFQKNEKGSVFSTERSSTTKATTSTTCGCTPIAANAGLSDAQLPDLRQTCATIFLMAVNQPKHVRELLGHVGISTTLDTFSHVIEGIGDGLADAMDEVL